MTVWLWEGLLIFNLGVLEEQNLFLRGSGVTEMGAPIRVCDDAGEHKVPVRLPLVGTRGSLRAGSRLRSG
jgi:hypothetical protein